MATTAPTTAHATGSRVDLRQLAAFALYAYAFSIPIDEIAFIPGIGSPARLLGLIAVGLGLVAMLAGGRLRFRRPLLLLVVAAVYALWSLATTFWSLQPGASLGEASRIIQLVAFAFLVQEFCRERARWLTLAQAFVLGNYVSFAMTAYTVLVVSSGFRDVGPFNANQFSVILALGIPMAAMLVRERSHGVWRLLNLLYPVVVLFGVVLAASRTGLIISSLGLLAVPFALASLGFVRRLLLAGATVGALVFSFSIAPQVFPMLFANLERLGETGEELTSGTLTERTTIWQNTLIVFESSPLVGIGAGAARFALAETEIGRVKAVHNAYLSVAASTGLIGLFLFLGVVGLAAVSAAAASRRDRPFMLVLVLALGVAMIPANSESRKDTWLVLSLLAVQRPIVLATPRGGGARTASTPRTHEATGPSEPAALP